MTDIWNLWTWGRSEQQTLGSQLIAPQNLPDRCSASPVRVRVYQHTHVVIAGSACALRICTVDHADSYLQTELFYPSLPPAQWRWMSTAWRKSSDSWMQPLVQFSAVARNFHCHMKLSVTQFPLAVEFECRSNSDDTRNPMFLNHTTSNNNCTCIQPTPKNLRFT